MLECGMDKVAMLQLNQQAIQDKLVMVKVLTHKLNQAMGNNSKLMFMIQQVGNLVIITVCNFNYLGNAYGKDSWQAGAQLVNYNAFSQANSL